MNGGGIGVLGFIRFFSIFISISISSFNVFADDNRIEHQFIIEYRAHLEAMADFSSTVVAYSSGDYIKMHPTVDAYLWLNELIESIPYRAAAFERMDVIKSIINIIDAYGELASKVDIERLNDLTDWVRSDLQEQKLIDMIARTSMSLIHIGPKDRKMDTLDNLNDELLRRDGILVDSSNSTKVRKKLQVAHEAALVEVDKFYEWMNSEVRGQEEILRSMQNLFLSDLLKNGKRKKPEIFYFMGLPGNGKDTIVESYVDALWRQKGAHETHMFPMKIRSKAEAWSYLGSGKGYVDSSDLPPFLKFLVEHSGGKYILGEQRAATGIRQVVERNPDWTPESSLFFKSEPHKAVIFINEAHNIPKEVKDNLLKEAIEKGKFPISNPGSTPNSVSQIDLMVTFVIASNEGISLLEPRERNGARMGEPLSYEDLLSNYERVYRDKALLLTTILQSYGQINDVVNPQDPGVSEEFLNRVGKARLFILKPLSPEHLLEIAEIMERKESELFEKAEGRLGRYKIDISDAMLKFLVNYDYIPSENARPIEDRLKSFVYDPIKEGIRTRKIRPSGGLQEITVDMHQYSNNAVTAVFRVKDILSGKEYQFTRLISQTLKDIPKEPLSQERINELLGMREKILANAFGVEHVVDKLIDSAIAAESEARNSGTSKRSATVMAFLGLTSTGKTETAKQYVKARYGDSAKATVIDFNGVRTLDAVEAKILGSYDSRKNPIKSEFMKAYDKAIDGNIAFILDEAANAPKEILKAIYEILREPVATGFSDGKARPMKNVTIIMTGNAGEKIYQQVPLDLPTDIREQAYREFFKIFMSSPDLQYQILQETFPDALLARLGTNIYHFGPHTNKSKRELSQLKLFQGFQALLPKPSERGWKLGFATETDFFRMLNMIEIDAYNVEGQGASIDKFLTQSVLDSLKANLLASGIASGEMVLLEVGEEVREVQDGPHEKVSRQLKLHGQNGEVIDIEIPLPKRQSSSKVTNVDRTLTGYHEAGHEIVSNFYFGDVVKGKMISVKPGVTLIGKSLLHYAGLRQGVRMTDYSVNREVVLREVAVLLGGYTAQQAVTLGARDDGGKSNDIKRATDYIQKGILRYGLSPEWGVRAVPGDYSNADYIQTLPQSEQMKLYRITDEWLREAEVLAKNAIMINFDTAFMELGKEVTSQGILNEKQIDEIYERKGMITERSGLDLQRAQSEVQSIMDWIESRHAKSIDKFDRVFTESNFSFEVVPDAIRFLDKEWRGLLGRFNPMAKDAWDSLTPRQKAVASSYISGKIKYSSRDARIASPELMPSTVADIDKIIVAEREVATKSVTDSGRFNIGEIINGKRTTSSASVMCRQIFQ